MKTRDWTTSAACRSLDPIEADRLFYPAQGRGASAATTEALALCSTCPVREACLAEALAVRDVDGVRGGRTGKQRLALVRR